MALRNKKKGKKTRQGKGKHSYYTKQKTGKNHAKRGKRSRGQG